MANVRYQLRQNVYMTLDGQPQIVLSGTVFDDVANTTYAASHVNILSPGETPNVVGKPTSVRSKRTA